MATIDVFGDKTRKLPCRGCGAMLKFATVVKSGALMPFNDAAPSISERMDDVTGRRVVTVDLAHSHFATCPRAKYFSKKKKRVGADATSAGR